MLLENQFEVKNQLNLIQATNQLYHKICKHPNLDESESLPM